MEYLISDCDGVLIDSEILAARMMVQYLSEYGIDITMNEYLSTWSGTTFSGIMQHFQEAHQLQLEEHFLQEITHRHEAILAEELQSVEGVKEAFESIDLPKAVVSNSFHWQVEHAVKVAKLESQFGGRIFSAVEVVENPKPAPDVYLYAAQQIDIDPAKVVVVEDSKSGVTSAVAAGMHVIGFTGASHILPGHDEKLLSLGASVVIDHMSKLPEAIKLLKSSTH